MKAAVSLLFLDRSFKGVGGVKIKAAILVDNMTLRRWQYLALRDAFDILDINVLLNCRNTSNKRAYFRNLVYYPVNALSLRNRMTRSVSAETLCQDVVSFDSIYVNRWQQLPDAVLDELDKRDIKVVIKFGMGLLSTSDRASHLDILSFHHGDPEHYRGRPAGFYELLNGDGKNGIIVQRLCDKLDGGVVYARAYSIVWKASYKKTAIAFYQASVPLLKKALESYRRGQVVESEPRGHNFRLPGNLLAMQFVGMLLFRKLRRAIYGAFFEKKWNVALLDGKPSVAALMATPVEDPFRCTGDIGSEFVFYADPFFSVDGSVVRVEALGRQTGLGEIIELDGDELTVRSGRRVRGGHFSYPFSFCHEGVEYLMPEVASHSSPFVMPLEGNEASAERKLRGLEQQRLVDATLYHHEGKYYLFCGRPESARTMLDIYYSDSPFDGFVAHPENPVVIDPERARMAGRLVSQSGVLYRFGQDSTGEYGNGITVCRIDTLTPQEYRETMVGKITLKRHKGPHTINFHAGKVVIDFYVDTFSLLAGYRRLVARLTR